MAASKDLQIPELSKQADGGTFTLLGEPDCEVRRTSDGTSLVVRLLGCDTYDPSDGTVRETDQDHIDCWMIDTDHDQMSFVARLTYFPNGLRNDAGLKAAMRSLGPDLIPDAQSHVMSFRSQPFDIPPDGRPIGRQGHHRHRRRDEHRHPPPRLAGPARRLNRLSPGRFACCEKFACAGPDACLRSPPPESIRSQPVGQAWLPSRP